MCITVQGDFCAQSCANQFFICGLEIFLSCQSLEEKGRRKRKNKKEKRQKGKNNKEKEEKDIRKNKNDSDLPA